MVRFIGRRLLVSLPVLFLLSLLVFLLFKLIPGDYLSEMELNPSVSKQQIDDLRQELGLDRSVPEQYLLWMGNLATGKLGYSFSQRRPAADLIWERLRGTAQLALGAFLLIGLVAIPLGVIAALRVGSWIDKTILWGSLIGLSLPTVLAAVAFLYLAYWTRWVPIGGSDSFLHMVFPTLTLALPAASFFVRTTRLELIDALNQPYITAAAAKGLPQYRIAWHAFRNAANPLISLGGLTVGGLLSGAVIVEKVFSWPGLGSLTVDSILNRDLFVAIDCVLISALMVILANLAADLLLAINDPRVRQQ